MISPGCVIQGEVRNSILSPGVLVEKGAVVSDSIVMHRTVIRRDAKVYRSIVDKRCEVGRRAQVGAPRDPGAVSGAEQDGSARSAGLVVVGKGTVIEDDSVVSPGETIGNPPPAGAGQP
jgi:glucose-1-phosphate adenylyltransferase